MENANGQLINYNIVGYIAIFFSLFCIPLAKRIKVVDTDVPSVSLRDPDKLKVEEIK